MRTVVATVVLACDLANKGTRRETNVDIDLVDLSYEEHYPSGMCALQDCDCQVDIHFFITYKNMCVRMTMRSFTLGMFKVQFPR